ncbi:MAG TPA: 3'-5' exonuclease [Anaeromyxobacteraceae bacterium]|nr:3'-5' exonuclease [Anaeromyxobacteraceae bacterium]
MRRYFALDVETVPDEALVRAVDGEPTRPYQEQLGRLLAARRAQSGGRSDFLPLPYHRPVAACTLEAEERDGALLVADVGGWDDARGDEGAWLAGTWASLQGRTLVTFHGRGFDLPVLGLRSLKLGLSAPAWFAPGDGGGGPAAHHDVFDLLSRGGGGSVAPLDLYAKLVGLPGKDGVAGKDVGSLYAEGARDRIVGYCMTDVLQTWFLYLRWRLLEGTLSPAGYTVSVDSCRERLPALVSARFEGRARDDLRAFLARCEPFLDELPADAVTPRSWKLSRA